MLEQAAARSSAAAAAFRRSAPYRALEAAFADRPGDAAVAAMLGDAGWVGDLIAPLVERLRDDPWFEPPFRVARDALRTGAILFENAHVTLAATILAADVLAAQPPPRTVVMAGRRTLTRYVRCGGARLRRWRAPPAGPDFAAASAPRCTPLPDLALADGDVVRHDGRVAAHVVTDAVSDVVTLAATIRAQTAPLAREYAVADGTLVRVATNDDRAARTQLLLSYLRLAGRRDARAYEAATHDAAFFLRWAAMREWLAADAQAALARLRGMAADDPHGEVRTAAAATLVLVEAQLAQRHAA